MTVPALETGTKSIIKDSSTNTLNMGLPDASERDGDDFHSASSNESDIYSDTSTGFHSEKEKCGRTVSLDANSENSLQTENTEEKFNSQAFQISPIIQGNTLKAFIIRPLTEFSAATRQFLDLLDLASGNTPSSGYSYLKDRISSLMKYASRKTWSNSQGPKWSGLGVGNIVKNVENRNKKREPELLKRGKFVSKKGGSLTEINKNAGKWQTEVSKNEFSNVPQPSLAEKLKSQMKAFSFRNKQVKEPEIKMFEEEQSEKSFETEEEIYTVNKRKGGMTVTSLIENVDESGFHFEGLTDLEKLEKQEEDSVIDNNHSTENVVREDDEKLILESSNDVPPEDLSLQESEHLTDEDGTEFILEPCIELDEDENLAKFIEENNSKRSSYHEADFSVASINDVLACQYESNAENPETGIQYFLEEECVMLSPYSNEAKLYKLLFPGNKIPVCETASECVEYSVEEAIYDLKQDDDTEVQSCLERIASENALNECVEIVELPVLTSPYTDDMWISDSDSEQHETAPERVKEPTPDVFRDPSPELPGDPTPEPTRDCTPEPSREPTPEPPRDPTPEPPRDPTPEPPREPTPEPARDLTPEPPRDPTPEPPTEPIIEPTREPTSEPTREPTPKPVAKKIKREPPKKKKKVYDRNFVKAVQMNQIDEVQQLISDGADPDTSCSIGTVLHQAVQLGFPHVVQNLLWGGSETEMRNELGDTPLHLAAIGGHNEIVMMLISHGCDVDSCNNYEITPLHMALSYGKLSVIQTLIRMNADLLCKDKIGDTPKMLVKQLGYPDNTLDPKEIVPLTLTPAPLSLVHAVEKGSLSDTKKALSMNASPNTLVPLALHWPGHSTVLHRAAHMGQTNIVRELLKAGSNPSARDLVGNTPLHTAVQDGHDDVVRLLVDHGANLNAVTQSGVTPLHRAAAKGHESTMILLLKCGANAKIKDNQNRTPLEWAKQKGYMVLARNLHRYVG